jgi:hypothetical protein
LGAGYTYQQHLAPGSGGNTLIRYSWGPAIIARAVALQRVYFALQRSQFEGVLGGSRLTNHYEGQPPDDNWTATPWSVSLGLRFF